MTINVDNLNLRSWNQVYSDFDSLDLDGQDVDGFNIVGRLFRAITFGLCWMKKFQVQYVGNSGIDGPLLTINSWQIKVDGQVLMDLDSQELTGHIEMVQMLMVKYYWSTTVSQLLMV